MLRAVKEEPNTPNVIVWKDRFDEQKVHRQQREKEIEAEDNVKNITLQRFEFLIFLFIGITLWFYSVYKILKWHRFPFHKHQLEVVAILFIPIFMIAFLLFIININFHKKND
jgi:hypothetical protein